MNRRHLFLWFAAGCLAYGFLFVRMFNLIFYPTYGSTDIWASTTLAIASTLCWLTLETLSHRNEKLPLVCPCGYSLKGVRCPECGKPVG
jgi:hypothetical protein